MQGAGCRVQGAGCRVQGAGCRVQGQCVGCIMYVARCRVQGAGCNLSDPDDPGMVSLLVSCINFCNEFIYYTLLEGMTRNKRQLQASAKGYFCNFL